MQAQPIQAAMAALARYPISISVVLAALAVTAAVFVFARPQYHPEGEGSDVEIDVSQYPPAADGWHWADGQPGFRFGEDEEAWNISQVKPAELAPVRAAARPNGIAPASVRVIDSIRLAPGDLSLLVAGTNSADKTCLGFATPSKTSFYCPPRLGSQSALILVTTRAPFETSGKTMYPTFITGIASGDVSRVVVNQSEEWPNGAVYDRERGSLWGTFELSLATGRNIDLTVLRENGAARTVHIDETTPGDRLISIAG
jgi:hypothetical protein